MGNSFYYSGLAYLIVRATNLICIASMGFIILKVKIIKYEDFI